jgi:glucuronoarabinoxylan endo-1,4-beta-xylanase
LAVAALLACDPGAAARGGNAEAAAATSAAVTTGSWSNVTPSNANLTDALSCGNYGVNSVQSDPSRPSDLYAHFYCQGLWRSTDYGQTWTGPVDTGANGATARDCAGGIVLGKGAPGAPPVIYRSCMRGAGTGFWRSTDGGVSWTRFSVTPSGSRQDFSPAAVDPYDTDHLLMAGHAMGLVVESTDGGQTWRSAPLAGGMNTSGGTAEISFIDTSSAATTRTTWLWIAQQAGGAYGTWRTASSGSSWTQVDKNEHPPGASQIYQAGGGVIYMAGAYSALGWGVLRSADYGQTWQHVGGGSNETAVWGTSANVYAGFGWAHGLGTHDSPNFESAAAPGTGAWTAVSAPAGLMEGPGAVAVTPSPSGQVWVGAMWQSGLWRYVEGSTGSEASPPPPPPSNDAPPPAAVTVTVSPASKSLTTSQTAQLTATVTGSSNTAVTWTVQEGTGGGSVSASGLYTAPASAGTFHVVATSQADTSKSATATVTVTAPPPPAVAVTVSPSATSVSSGKTAQLSATVTGSSNTAVTWTVKEGSAGGGVSSAGLYTAPSAAGTFHVVATSQADTSKSATATVTVSVPGAQDFTVNRTDLRQTMDGFGGSDYRVPTMSASTLQLLFDTTKGIGLSIYRLGLNKNDPTTPDPGWASVKAAVAAYPDLKVWAAPWTPPAAYKSNNSLTNGGYLCHGKNNPASPCTTDYYPAWSDALAAFPGYAKAQGVTIWGMSPQNEPDYPASYESADYYEYMMRDFVKVLGPKLHALDPPVKLLAPDLSDWTNKLPSYVASIEADPDAVDAVDLYATHQYNGVHADNFSRSHTVWETEMSSFEGFDASIANGVKVATWIHDAIVTGGVSAWHYWWFIGRNSDNEGLIGHDSTFVLTKRLYTMGNFSRWVRPGWVRVGVTGSKSGIYGVTAYTDTSTGDFAIVVINNSGNTVGNATFAVTGGTVGSVQAYVTTDTAIGNIGTDGNLSLGSSAKGVAASYAVSGNTFTAPVPAGVTTFVGTAR